MKNVVVQVKSREHGAKVIQAFKDLGVNTDNFNGTSVGVYYGLFDGDFNYDYSPEDSQVITIEELQAMANPYPKEMMVWDDDEEHAVPMTVVAKVEHEGLVSYVTFNKGFHFWKHAKPIEDDLTQEERIQRLEYELKKLKG